MRYDTKHAFDIDNSERARKGGFTSDPCSYEYCEDEETKAGKPESCARA
jgi:hypothetical protein